MIKTISTSFEEGLQKTHLPIIKLKHKEKEYNFLIDTGSDISYLYYRKVKELEGRNTNITIPGVCFGQGSCETTPLFEVDLTLNSWTFTETFATPNLDDIVEHFRKEYNTDFTGVLGSDFLSKYHYIINFKKKRLYVQRPDLPDIISRA